MPPTQTLRSTQALTTAASFGNSRLFFRVTLQDENTLMTLTFFPTSAGCGNNNHGSATKCPGLKLIKMKRRLFTYWIYLHN
jgi:hypothetical protein